MWVRVARVRVGLANWHNYVYVHLLCSDLMYRRPPGGAGYGYGYGRRGRRADGSLASLLLFNLVRQLQQLDYRPPGLLLLLVGIDKIHG